MKFIYASAAALALFFAATFVIPMQHLRAEDMIRLNDQDIVMSGTITDLDDDGFILSTGETSTQVSFANLKNNADVTGLLKDGMKVTVRGALAKGAFNDPEIRASDISAFQEPSAPGTPIPNAKPAQ